MADARCALAGAKAAKVVHFKAPKLTDSKDDKKKKRDMVKSAKDYITQVRVQDIFPDSVMRILNAV